MTIRPLKYFLIWITFSRTLWCLACAEFKPASVGLYNKRHQRNHQESSEFLQLSGPLVLCRGHPKLEALQTYFHANLTESICVTGVRNNRATVCSLTALFCPRRMELTCPLSSALYIYNCFFLNFRHLYDRSEHEMH